MNWDKITTIMLIVGLMAFNIYLLYLLNLDITEFGEQLLEVRCGTQGDFVDSVIQHPTLPNTDLYGSRISNYSCELVCTPLP